METYFCDPYCSWQKGGVEQGNLLLREEFPRNIALADLIQSKLDDWVGLINAWPMKSLSYKTAELAFIDNLRQLK